MKNDRIVELLDAAEAIKNTLRNYPQMAKIAEPMMVSRAEEAIDVVWSIVDPSEWNRRMRKKYGTPQTSDLPSGKGFYVRPDGSVRPTSPMPERPDDDPRARLEAFLRSR